MNDDIRIRIQTLTEELKAASDSYYNTGTELMSNYEYDKKFDELKALEEAEGITDGFTSRVGAKTSSKLEKVVHEFEAKSLGKTKDINEVIAVHENLPSKDVCLSWKLDGSTLQLTYDGGRLALAATRGDGRTGQDITRNAEYIAGIPKTIDYTGHLVVRGECLMSYKEFDRLNTDGIYANPRNLANATITALDKDVLKDRHTEFMAFELVFSGSEAVKELAFSKKLDYLKTLGFGVVPHTRVGIKDLKAEMDRYTKEASDFEYPVDGLVIANEDTALTKNLTGTEHHPHLAKGMAFKWQDEKVQTKLTGIEWSPSRTGLLNPVAVFDTVDLCGTKVSRASLHNLSYVQNLNLRIGDTIEVYKANMIIPQLADNLDKDNHGKTYYFLKCPCCKSVGVIHTDEKSGVRTVMCENEECSAKQLGRITHFASKHGMNIEGLSEATISVMLDKGYIKTAADLYTLKDKPELVASLKQEEGFGEKSVENLLDAIEKSRDTDFSHLMYAFGIDGFGRGQIKLLKGFLDENYDTLTCDSEFLYGRKPGDYMELLGDLTRKGEYPFEQIEGIGKVLGGSLNNWLLNNYREDSAIKTVLEQVNLRREERKEAVKSDISGKTFVVTGSLEGFANRDEFTAFMESKGLKSASSVSAKTDFLVNNDVTSTSGKNKKAKALGIPIVSEKDAVLIASGEMAVPVKERVKDKGLEKD